MQICYISLNKFIARGKGRHCYDCVCCHSVRLVKLGRRRQRNPHGKLRLLRTTDNRPSNRGMRWVGKTNSPCNWYNGTSKRIICLSDLKCEAVCYDLSTKNNRPKDVVSVVMPRALLIYCQTSDISHILIHNTTDHSDEELLQLHLSRLNTWLQ